jgi:phosphotransacetylase
MTLPTFEELYRIADASAQQAIVAAVGADDPSVLTAMTTARRRGWIEPILVGDALRIREIAAADRLELDGLTIVDAPASPAMAAVAEVRTGRASLLLKGQVSTPDLMRAVLERGHGLRTERAVCQVVLMEIPRDGRRFLLADTGITPHPTLGQKQDVLRSLVETAQRLGVPCPKIAVMSATEKATPALPDTADAVRLVEQAAAGEFGACHVAGPLSFDLAYASIAGARKGISGAVVGGADAMLFPDLLSANLTVKAIMYTADCRYGGMLAGTASPLVFMSRADNVETRLNSLAFALATIS